MNGPSDSFEDSSWDSLAIDLGLEPATPSKSPKTPAVELPKPTPVPRKSEPKRPHEPEAAAEEFGDIAEEKLPIVHPAKPVQPDVEVDDFDPTGEDTVLDEVLESDDDGGSLDESAGPGETTDGQVAGKKRRRRRRRKKSGGEATPASPAMAAEEKKAPARRSPRRRESLFPKKMISWSAMLPKRSKAMTTTAKGKPRLCSPKTCRILPRNRCRIGKSSPGPT